MKLDKKRLPQLIVLGVIMIGCVCYVSFQLGPGNSTPPAPKKTPKAQVEVREAPVEQASEASELVTKAVFPGLDTTVARRDPFQPVKLPVDPTDVLPQDFVQPKPVSAKASVTVRPTAQVPQIKVNPFNPFTSLATATSGSGESNPAPAVAEEKDPDFALTGIVRGAENVAVIRVGSSGRYVVKQGQYVEGRYQVLSVTQDSATLLYNGRRIHIKLGGVKNAS